MLVKMLRYASLFLLFVVKHMLLTMQAIPFRKLPAAGK